MQSYASSGAPQILHPLGYQGRLLMQIIIIVYLYICTDTDAKYVVLLYCIAGLESG